MKKGGLTILIIILIVAGVLIYLFMSGQSSFENIFGSKQVQNETPQENAPVIENVVELTSTGFKPNLLVIKQGESVTWINNASPEHWIASNNHPTHRTYPGSDIEKCGTAEESMIFDSCRALKQGESYTFKFDKRGTWKYHDHLNPGRIATIAVQ